MEEQIETLIGQLPSESEKIDLVDDESKQTESKQTESEPIESEPTEPIQESQPETPSEAQPETTEPTQPQSESEEPETKSKRNKYKKAPKKRFLLGGQRCSSCGSTMFYIRIKNKQKVCRHCGNIEQLGD